MERAGHGRVARGAAIMWARSSIVPLLPIAILGSKAATSTARGPSTSTICFRSRRRSALSIGSDRRNSVVRRATPRRSLAAQRRWEESPTMISRLPPPRSKHTAGAGSMTTAARMAVKIRRASSMPSIASASIPASSAMRSRTSSPLLALRSALVAQARISVAPAASAMSRNRRIVATVASAASGVIMPSRLTTSPSRSISFSPLTGVRLPSGCTSAITRWNEFEPRSTAATRIDSRLRAPAVRSAPPRSDEAGESWPSRVSTGC